MENMHADARVYRAQRVLQVLVSRELTEYSERKSNDVTQKMFNTW